MLVEQLRAQGRDREADMARATRRFIFAAFSRDTPFNDSGELSLKLLECPQSVFQGMGKVLQEWEKDFTDLDEGFDLEINRNSQSSSGFTKYEVRAKTKREGGSMNIVPSPLTEDERQLVMESFPDLDTFAQPPDIDEFAAALGMPTPEPPVTSGLSSSPTTPAAAGPPTTTASSAAAACPLFGDGWEADDEACRECTKAEECKSKMEGKLKVPKRRPA